MTVLRWLVGRALDVAAFVVPFTATLAVVWTVEPYLRSVPG